MKTKILVLIFVMMLPMLSIAQQKMIDVKISKEARTSLIDNKLNRTKIEQKFASGLIEVIAQYKLSGNTLQPKPGAPKIQSLSDDQPSLAQVDTKDRVLTYIYFDNATSSTSFVKKLQTAGVTVHASTDKASFVEVWATVPQLQTIASWSDVKKIELIARPVHDVGAAITLGDSRMRADLTRNLLSVDGTGIKIGVMSDDCGSTEPGTSPFQASINSGDILNTTVALDDGLAGGRSHEGLAMMEIVQDLAPKANIYFATADNGGQAAYAANIQNLYNNGCRIITDDVFSYDEPVFEDGIIAQKVDAVTAGGAIYTCSAGNAAQFTLFSTFNPLINQSVGGGPATSTVHNFGGGSGLDVTAVAAGKTITVALQWDDPYLAVNSRNDFDLYLVNGANNAVLASSTSVQNDGSPGIPYEVLSYTNGTAATINANIMIKRTGVSAVDANGTARFRLEARGNGFSPSTLNTSAVSSIYGHHGAATAIATGAIDATNGNYNTIEGFSSQGPVLIYNTGAAAPRPLIATRVKPEITSFDGAATTVAGFQPFYGTSAAAPHSAAMAVLLRSKFPAITPASALTAMKNGCIDYGTAGMDNVFGAGRTDAYRMLTLQMATNAPSTFVSGYATPSTTITDNTPAGINSVINLAPPCSAITPDSVYVSVTIDGHNKAGDLKITLTSPDNTTITLMNRPVSGAGNGTAKDPNVILGDLGTTGSIQTANPAGAEELGFYIPANVISSNAGFRGHAISGNWTLNVSDNAAGNTGTLKDWGLMIKEGLPTPPALVINWAPPFIFPNDHTMRNITVSNSLSGGCSPAIQLLSITSNEADFTADPGDVATDIQGATTGTNDLAFQLRSEALSSGNGRFYTVTYRITDIAGYQRDTMFAIPAFASPGRVDPSVTVAAGSGTVTLDVAPRPNPLVTSSVISYTITAGTASAVPVLLTIVNNRGKWVRNLDYSSRAPGTYNVAFDGNAADGTPLPNGVYAYQLTIGAPYNSLNTGVMIINRP